MSRRIFLIGGMHRSGTSYLAQSLGFIGLELPVTTQPIAPDNPKGHFESFGISQYHERLLSDMSLSWDTFIPPPENWFSSEYAEQAIAELSEKIESEYPSNGPLVLKDPRLSLLIPLWRKVVARLGFQDYYIIPFRHPFEVAASLDRRNKMGKTRALLIWLAYLFEAEKRSRNLDRSFVCFPQWTQDFEQSIAKIENDLGAGFPKNNKKNLLNARREFEKNLVHHNERQISSANNDIEKLALDVFKNYLVLEEAPNDTRALAKLDKLKHKFNTVSAPFTEIINEIELNYRARSEQQLGESEGRATELEQQLQTSQRESEQAATWGNTLQQQLTEAESHSTTLGQQLTKTEGRATELEQQLQTSQRENEQSAAQADTLQQQLGESEVRATELEQQLQTEILSKQQSHKEVNELKVQNCVLVKEYERLLLEYNKQKLTVLRPIYRNIYRSTGLVLRKTFPSAWVESLKKITPNPDGVTKRLTYKPPASEKLSAPYEVFTPAKTTSNTDIFILSIINWDFRVQRPQHIAKGLAESGRRVFYIEMELADSNLELTKLSDNLYRARLPGEDIRHIQPYTGQPDPEQTEQWLSAFYQLCDTVGCTAFKQVIVQHPFWWQLARHLPPEYQIVFDCMDDISGFSNTEQFLLDLEHDLLSRCDKLIVSSQQLFNKYKHYQAPKLIRNAAEIDHFPKSAKKVIRPAFLERYLTKGGSEKIRVGYVGAIAEWFDADLLKGIAQTEPAFEFHLCGAVTAKEPAQLETIENIHFHGEIPYTDVPGFINEMDVMIIPFKIVPIIMACDPVKFYEYSAMGKPTVATALPELSRVGSLCFSASTPLEFAEHIRNAYQKGKIHNFRSQLREYAGNNTWHHRTSQFKEILKEMPKVTIIILAYGDPELTKATLHSLYTGGPAYPNLEALIVDNGSTADVVNDIKGFASKYPNVQVIENGENLGFAKGNNVGLETATGEYVMLLNNDTVVAPGAVYAMVRHLARNPAIGAVGPLTNNIGNEAKLFVEYSDMDQMREIARRATTGYRGLYTPVSVVAYFAVMFRRKDLQTFGLLSEEYGRGMFEDDDHCAMIKSKGYICALAEDAFIHHHLSATFSTLKDGEKEALFEANKKKFEDRWETWQPHKYRENRPMPSYTSRG